MAEFILLIREDLTRYPIPEEQLTSLIAQHTAWAKELSARGIFRNGYGVGDQGVLLAQVDDEIQALPIQDAKHGIGGFYVIEAEDLDAAIEIGRGCPTFKDGDQLEVRPLM